MKAKSQRDWHALSPDGWFLPLRLESEGPPVRFVYDHDVECGGLCAGNCRRAVTVAGFTTGGRGFATADQMILKPGDWVEFT